MVRLLNPSEGMSVYDPTAGSGGMLIQSAQHLEEQGQDPRKLELCGQEKDGAVVAVCKMNLFLHDLTNGRIEFDDTLERPKLRENGGARRFDRVLANPPFSELYDKTKLEIPARFAYGYAPEKKKADLMFVQHILASLKTKGRAVCVMPHGVLFRGAQEKAIRRALMCGADGARGDVIEAIIGLPPKLFYGTGIPACLLVLNPSKTDARRGKILFVNADREFAEGKNQNTLRPEDIDKIVSVVSEFRDVAAYSRLVDLKEIETHDYNLNIRRTMENTPDPEPQDVRAHLLGGVPQRADIRRSWRTTRGALSKLLGIADEFLKAAGVNQKIEPMNILSADFEREVGNYPRTKTKAAAIEHAVRNYLEVNWDEDPALFDSFSQSLDKVLLEHANNWDEIYNQLEQLRLKIKNREEQDSFGLDRKRQMPLYRQVLAQLFPKGDDDAAPAPVPDKTQQSALLSLTRGLSETLEREVQLPGFWDSKPAQAKLKREMIEVMASEESFLIFGKPLFVAREALANRMIEWARSNRKLSGSS